MRSPGLDAKPLTNDDLPTHTRQEFCLALKAARERNGLSLADITEATKIPAAVLAALERGDLRSWPNGLYRRSFFRDYARTIGVPVAETCAEFVRLFPDRSGAAPADPPAQEPEKPDEVRLSLDEAWHGSRRPVLTRLLAAAIDAVAVVLVSAALVWITGLEWTASLAILALAYFSVATMLFGESPARRALARGQSMLPALTPGEPASAEDHTVRTWISDAHRVGPRARLRVRIKVPQ